MQANPSIQVLARKPSSANALTLAAYASFVPIGVATVLLGPMLPTLSARWSLNYSQAGALFNAQYFASTCAVALSGALVARRGFRFPIKIGLLFMGSGLALLMAGPKLLGIFCIATYGAGLGLAVPAANLLVAEANPGRRSSALNLLNFFWSTGAVACPFLVATAAKSHNVPLFLAVVSVISVLVAVGIAAMPSTIVEPAAARDTGARGLSAIPWSKTSFWVLAGLFFLYVGTENAFGGWVASYAKSLSDLTPAMSLMTPSFFYGTLMIGRWLAPFALRTVPEVRLVQAGLFLGCAGTAGLMFSHELGGVIVSACTAGLGLSSVYPITIALSSREFGSSSRIGSLLFTVSNIGGGLLPWISGFSSNRFGTLRAGLFVPLVGCAAMYALNLHWKQAGIDQLQQG